MVLSHEELRSLIEVSHRSPHQLLGMHPLGNGAGVVVRAFVPGADKVEVQPVHEKEMPALTLERIHDSGVFEGVINSAKRVYAYDRSEEHTSELQSLRHLVCRLLLEKKKNIMTNAEIGSPCLPVTSRQTSLGAILLACQGPMSRPSSTSRYP